MLSFLVQGKWLESASWNTLADPLNGESFIKVAEVDEREVQVSQTFFMGHFAVFQAKKLVV